MFQKLRKKFIFIAMFSVTVVLVGILGFINVFYYLQINREADNVLSYLAMHGGVFPENSFRYGDRENQLSEETPFKTRFFTVAVNEIDDVTSINMGHVAAILPSEAYNYALAVESRGKSSGYYQGYKYLITRTQTGYQIIFLDRHQELEGMTFLALSSIGIGGISLIIIFILISILSKPIIEPVIENITKQRQFIADASHEIKTPLAIISADTDVIEIEYGKDEWTQSIKDQIVRLNGLVKDMLTLSKMDGDMAAEAVTTFNLSQIVKDTAEEFTPIAFNENKEFSVHIEPEIEFSGNADGVKQLVSVLLNNAFKYTDKEGTIILDVQKRGKGAVIDLSNTTDAMPEGDLKRLFDRFYRADSSRSRSTGSYGIGLSIAQAVTKQHKGTISAKRINDHTISFRASLNSI